jgi:tripartite ATP-independent transporter DctM subunit
MDPLMISCIMLGLLIIGIASGLHVGVVLAASAMLGLWWITGDFLVGIRLLETTAYRGIMEYAFGVLPMFALLGSVVAVAGIGDELYDASSILLSGVRGGLAMATVIANAIFAAITGVSLASVVIFCKIAIPQMNRLGYEKRFSLGCVAGSSVLGMLIPPSALFIIYGVLTEQAIGKLFIAGILPGILLTIIYCLGILILVRLRPDLAPLSGKGEKPSLSQVVQTMTRTVWSVALIVLVLGGIWFGFFTPTEAGAIGAFGALLLALLRKRLNLSAFWQATLDTGYVCASIFFLLITSQMYSRMLTVGGLAEKTSAFVVSLSLPPIMILWMFVIVFIIAGAFLDSSSILLICIPLMLPILKALNMDLIWFGVIAVVAIEMGLLTPPFGMAVFAIKAVLRDECTVAQVFVGALPFLIMMFVCLVLLVHIPWFSLYLIQFMG